MHRIAKCLLCGALAAALLATSMWFCSGPPILPGSFAQGQEKVVWRKVWSDEFHGSRLDTRKWNVIDSGNPHNNELQYYVPDEVWLQESKLVLRSRRRSYSGPDGTRDFTSGKVTTQNKFSFRYGTIEMRAKMPSGRGIWPAFWMLPVDGGWPPEIDIFELLGHDPHRVYMNNHWGDFPNQQSALSSFAGPNFSAGYHRFTLEWQPGWMRWKVDGVPRREVTQNVPDRQMYLILNTAIGGDWPGAPDGATNFPQEFRVDYIQVFQRFAS
jgi:beta-glucanase (GH16 family)